MTEPTERLEKIFFEVFEPLPRWLLDRYLKEEG